MNFIRHDKIILKPIVITNENVSFPICHMCHHEKSPFLLEDTFSITMVKDNLKIFLSKILLDSIWEREEGGLIIFLCNTCMQRE